MANSLLKKISVAVSVVFSAVTAWFYVPKAVWFLSSALPPFYTALRSWLNHPSIFLAINFIILLIFRFSQKFDHHYPHGGAADIAGDKPKVELDGVSPTIPDVDENSSDEVVYKKNEVDGRVSPPTSDVAKNSPHEVVYRKNKAEQPPVDGGTASDASCLTTETEADAEEAQSTEDSNVSMEATWQTIMANKDAPARGLQKSETRERRLERTAGEAAVPAAPAPEKKKEMKKSQTFRDGRRMPEPLDEMDKKFDAFIQKNYDQMRRR